MHQKDTARGVHSEILRDEGISQEMTAMEQLKYLRLLSRQYPTIRDVSVEIIALLAILRLPKGTEHFISDIHGEYESFHHVMRNASGAIKTYIHELFAGEMTEPELKTLATLVYYPNEKLRLIKKQGKNTADWYRVTLVRLVTLCRRAASKYTRSKVQKSIDPHFAYIIGELLHAEGISCEMPLWHNIFEAAPPSGKENRSKHAYYRQIIDGIVHIGRADDYIIELSQVIRRLAIDRLHVIGDMFDRGPDANKVLDDLLRHHAVDVQWGNHDIVWMGAAAGSAACVLNVIRMGARYANLHTLEDGYGINLIPLVMHAIENAAEGDLDAFWPEVFGKRPLPDKEALLIAQIHRAAAILQFKVEAEIISRHPEYRMHDRLLLHRLSEMGLGMPTIDPENPYHISDEEADIIDKLVASFQGSQSLQAHMSFLLSKGSMYKICNGNLLFHGCVPMNKDGTLKAVEIDGRVFRGKRLLDVMEEKVREGCLNHSNQAARLYGQDMMWYLWCGTDSPLFGCDKMATFERYFLKEESLRLERRNPYFSFRDNEEICKSILSEFGLDPDTSHIINGHVPVKVAKGESPIKANGRLLVIDGGFAKAYQASTGIAGYTLICNSRAIVLVSHEPFESTQKAIEAEIDIHASSHVVEYSEERVRVADTDNGKELMDTIEDLTKLLAAYETGKIKQGT